MLDSITHVADQVVVPAAAYNYGVLGKVNSSGQFEVTGATEWPTHILLNDCDPTETRPEMKKATIRPIAGQTGLCLRCTSSFSPFANAYLGANGCVSNTGQILIAMADRDGVAWASGTPWGRFIPVSRAGFAVVAKTANYTITDAEAFSGMMRYTNAGASGAITFALPAARVGMKIGFRVSAVQELRVDPHLTETISLTGTGVPQAAGKYLGADAIGEALFIECIVAGTWTVVSSTGTWTIES